MRGLATSFFLCILTVPFGPGVESRLEKLREEHMMLKKEDKKVQAELEAAELESNRLNKILEQKQLDLQKLRERVHNQRGGKTTMMEKAPKDIYIFPWNFGVYPI